MAIHDLDHPLLDLGRCCACGGIEQVRNIMVFSFKGPVPGKGWGCFQCGLPMDGATAVICDACLERRAEIREICRGWPGDKQRVPMPDKASRMSFDHDLSKHPELVLPDGACHEAERACMVCGCTDGHACPGGCHWVDDDLCSRCAEELELI